MFLIFLVSLFSATDDDRATKPPPPKRPRGGEVTITTDEVASHEECVLQLQEECKQTKPSKKKLKRLMKSTYNGRRAWVIKDAPPVTEILEIFPPLKKPKHVSCECSIKWEMGRRLPMYTTECFLCRWLTSKFNIITLSFYSSC